MKAVLPGLSVNGPWDSVLDIMPNLIISAAVSSLSDGQFQVQGDRTHDRTKFINT
jgi:hypothetical protein